MKLIPVEKLPERHAKHKLQDLIRDFINGGHYIVLVDFTDLDYKSASVCYSCLHTAIKRSKTLVKVRIRGDKVYLLKHD